MFRVALRLLLAAALGAVPSLARADVYRWVDDSGATHYATTLDEVPSSYRDTVDVIKPPAATIPNPSDARPPEPPPRPAAAPSPPASEPTPARVEPPPALSAPEPAPSSPQTPPASESSAPLAPPIAPTTGPTTAAPAAAPSEVERSRQPEDPRAEEIAQLEGQLERDRETLRQLISTPRWDSAELAADPRVREIAERMPRLQAELAALRTDAGH